MRKPTGLLLLTPALALGLAACGNDEGAINDGGNNSYEPVGYYSDAGHGNDNNDEHDGPATELYDHSIGPEQRAIREHKQKYLQVRDENGNPRNPSTPLSKEDGGFFARDNEFSHGDANYHDHLDNQTGGARTASDGKLAVRIADAARSVKNVHDVRSVAYGSDVLIAVNLEDYSQEEKTKERIKDAVKPYLNGRSCTVVTDEGTFIRLRNLDHDFHDDGPYEKIGDTDLRDIFGTIREQTGR